jgi:penicillin amidase
MMKFAEQPQIVNPKQGYLANWNNKPAVWWDNADTPVWGEIFHNGRILERLAAKPKVTTDDLRDILVDIGTNDYTAQVFLPLLTDALRNNPTLTPEAKTAAAILFAWDHRATEGSVAKTLFDVWLQQVREDLFLKPFGFIQVQGKDLFNTAMQPSFILHVLRDRVSPVPVQYSYLNGKMPQAVIADAWNKAVEKLAKQRGMSPSGWGYTQGQISFKPLPGIPKTDRGTYIQIIECAKNDVHGVNILPPGQNEREDSAHFGDQRELAGWFLFKPMRIKRDILEREAEEPEGRKAKP